jgi:hypothetical protein
MLRGTGGRAPLISAVGGVSRQSYSLVAVPAGKQLPVTVEKRLVGLQIQSGRFGEEKTILSLLTIEAL